MTSVNVVNGSRVALPHGNDNPPETGLRPPSARVHADTHARASVDQRAVNAKEIAAKVAAAIWGDFTRSWITSGSTPTIRSYLAAEWAAPAPHGRRWLRGARLGYVCTLGVAGMAVGHVLAHVLQSPIRAAVALLTAGAVVLIRVLG